MVEVAGSSYLSVNIKHTVELLRTVVYTKDINNAFKV